MVWQEDRELSDWLFNAVAGGGGFVSAIAEAAMRADGLNYPILRPALLQLKDKYPKYAQAPVRL